MTKSREKIELKEAVTGLQNQDKCQFVQKDTWQYISDTLIQYRADKKKCKKTCNLNAM